MVIPNYAYLKLKVLGLCCVIMMSGNFHNAYQCKRDVVEYNNLDSGGSQPPLLDVGEEAPDDDSGTTARRHPRPVILSSATGLDPYGPHHRILIRQSMTHS